MAHTGSQGVVDVTSHSQDFRVVLGTEISLEDGWDTSASRAGATHVCPSPCLCDAITIKYKLIPLLMTCDSTFTSTPSFMTGCTGFAIGHAAMPKEIQLYSRILRPYLCATGVQGSCLALLMLQQ